MYRMAQSIAIGMRAITSVKRHSQVNLRRGEFAYVQDYESVFKGAGIAFKVIGVALSLLLILYSVQYVSYRKHIDSLKAQYKKELVTIMPHLKKKYKKSKIVTLKSMRNDAKSYMRSTGADKHRAVSSFLAENSQRGPLVLLQQLSEAIPKEHKLDVIRYHFSPGANGTGRLVLKGETDTFDSSAAILDALKKMEAMDGVEEKSSGYKPGSDKKKD